MGAAQTVEERDNSLRARHDYAWNEVRQIVGRIWKYVLIGVGIGALIHGYVPADFVARIAGDGSVLSVIVAVLAGVPMYSDAVGIIPVAEALLGKGVPAGHRAGLHDGGHRAVAAGNADPAQSRQMALARHLCRLSRRARSCWSASCSTVEELPMSDLHPSIIALVSLAANIAANHPKQGLCQVDRLKGIWRCQGADRHASSRSPDISATRRAEQMDAKFDEPMSQAMSRRSRSSRSTRSPTSPWWRPVAPAARQPNPASPAVD
jgi:hypothetical protein